MAQGKPRINIRYQCKTLGWSHLPNLQHSVEEDNEKCETPPPPGDRAGFPSYLSVPTFQKPQPATSEGGVSWNASSACSQAALRAPELLPRAGIPDRRCCPAPGLGSVFSALALMPGSDELPCWYPRCSLRWGPAPSPTGGPASGGVLGWRLPLLPSAHRQSPRSPGHQPPLGPCPVPLCQLLKQLQPLLCGCESPLHPAPDDHRRDTLREGRRT